MMIGVRPKGFGGEGLTSMLGGIEATETVIKGSP